MADLSDRLDASVRASSASVRSAVESSVQEQRQLLAMLSEVSEVHQSKLNNLTRILADALQKGVLVVPIKYTTPSTASPQATVATKQLPPTPPPVVSTTSSEPQPPAVVQMAVETNTAAADGSAVVDSGVSAPHVMEFKPEAPAKTKQSSETIELLRNWVVSSLDQIMKRSLNQWSKPEELLRDAPVDLRYTARLLDPGGKLVLICATDSSQCLALVLPGGYVDTWYYDWFTPKGIGRRIERTQIPALVDASATGYQVLQPGVVEQE
jgi:hypothetical protein